MMTKTIIMMYGYPATGKTTLAKKLTKSLEHHNANHVATLDTRKELNLFDLESEDERNIVYGHVADKVKRLIENKEYNIIIIDGNFNKRERREKIYSITKDCEVYVIKCVVHDENIIKQRIEERKKKEHIHENKASTMELFHMIKDASEDVEEDEEFKNEIINLIQYNSKTNKIEEEILIKNKNTTIMKDILSSLK
jgi:predicted kinase